MPLQVDVGKNGHITYTEFIAATLVVCKVSVGTSKGKCTQLFISM